MKMDIKYSHGKLIGSPSVFNVMTDGDPLSLSCEYYNSKNSIII